MKRRFASSIMLCHPDDDPDCPVCNYLDGAWELETLEQIIAILDRKLAEKERAFDALVKLMIVVSEKQKAK